MTSSSIPLVRSGSGRRARRSLRRRIADRARRRRRSPTTASTWSGSSRSRCSHDANRLAVAAVRAGQHVAEPVRAPGPARRGGAGVGLVHRLSAVASSPAAARPTCPRSPTARLWDAFRRIGIDALHTGPVKLAGGLNGRRLTPSIDGHFDRISHGGRPGVRHRGAVPDAVRDRGRVRGHGDRRHRPGPHGQGRRLPAGRDGLRGLPGHLPHGLDRARGLGPAARRARGPRQRQPRRRHRGDARALRLHHRPPPAGDLLRARDQGDQLVGDARA